jgi:putative dimethyl sulfoxide reductase chaperone
MSGRTSIKTPSDTAKRENPADIEQLLARSQCYRVISFLFRHPSVTKDCFSVEEDVPKLGDAIGIIKLADKARLKDSFKKLIREIGKTSPTERIRQYENCFGHTAHGPVPYYELEYGEEHTHRQPQQLGDIAAFYNAFGLKINAKIHERVDHISVECEFMQFLIYKEAYALQHNGEEKAQICREASCRFLRDHLGLWVPAFTLRLSKFAGQGLMKQIADFAFAFVVQDCRQSGISPGTYDLPIRAVTEQEDSGCMTCSSKPDLHA